MTMKITVLGCGRWGSFHAWYADHIGHEAMLWGRPGSSRLARLMAERRNEYLTLPESVALSEDLEAALRYATHILHIGARIFFGPVSDYLSSETGASWADRGGNGQ